MKVSSVNFSVNQRVGVFKSKELKNGTSNTSSIKELPKIYYTPLNFTRRWSEHKSWGAVINPETKDVTFKLFSFPDNKSTSVEIIDEYTGQVRHSFEMKPAQKYDGIYESEKIPKKFAKNGDTYRYVIERPDGTIHRVKDPYSLRQKKLLGESVLYDNSLFNWTDKSWFENNPARISRLANKINGLKNIQDARIYEFNTATFSKEGTFDGAIKKLKEIKDFGFNTIEIMPVENTFSYNWGYDGVDKFAPSEHLGGPDGLKRLINEAHKTGLNVIMDMVPNHYGPDGNTLSVTGPYIKGPNEFGDAINYEGKNSQYVRDLMVNVALNWLDNYHCDGLRLDMTKYMESDYTMKQIAAEVNYHFPDAVLIAEDARSSVAVDNNGKITYSPNRLHDERVTRPLLKHEYSGVTSSEVSHEKAISSIYDTSNENILANLGYDSEWDFAYFHQIKEALYENVNLDSLYNTMEQSTGRVKYVMSHDEIGNYDGTRLVAKLMVPMLSLYDNVILSQDDYARAEKLMALKGQSYDDAIYTVKNQKAQLLGEILLTSFLTGSFDEYIRPDLMYYWLEPPSDDFINEVLLPLGIKAESNISAEQIREMYLRSYSICKAGMALTYSIPGPKMVFQGDESIDVTPFRFFREFQSLENDYKNLCIEKGYDAGEKGLDDSTLGNIDYSNFAISKMNKYLKLLKDLNKISSENPAMNDGYYVSSDTVKHEQSKLIGVHTKAVNHDNELFTITNFAGEQYPREDCDRYKIKFPKGNWVEILNTDDKEYGGRGYINKRIIVSDGTNQTPINVGKYSTLIFKKVN